MTLQSMVTATLKSKRINTLDLLRGHFLLAILITHYYKFPSPYIYYFGRGELWVSSAPGFVFISGLVIGMISRRRMINDGLSSAVEKIFKRGFKLYLISALLTVAYTMIGLHIGKWQHLNYGLLNASFGEILLKTLLFQYSYGWADLLLYYSVMLMFVAPLVLWFISKGWWKVLLVLSSLLWLGVYFYPGDQKLTGSYIPVESWQFLFVVAMLTGYYKDQISPLYRKLFYGEKSKSFLVVFFALTFITLVISIADRFYGVFDSGLGPFFDKVFYKRELGPGLVFMFFFWFSGLYYIFQRFEALITRFLGWLYLPFGRNSLLTYTVQSIFLFVQFYLPLWGSYWWNAFTTTVLVLLVWVAVKALLYTEQIVVKKPASLPK
jgi:hypothetical protein